MPPFSSSNSPSPTVRFLFLRASHSHPVTGPSCIILTAAQPARCKREKKEASHTFKKLSPQSFVGATMNDASSKNSPPSSSPPRSRLRAAEWIPPLLISPLPDSPAFLSSSSPPLSLLPPAEKAGPGEGFPKENEPSRSYIRILFFFFFFTFSVLLPLVSMQISQRLGAGTPSSTATILERLVIACLQRLQGSVQVSVPPPHLFPARADLDLRFKGKKGIHSFVGRGLAVTDPVAGPTVAKPSKVFPRRLVDWVPDPAGVASTSDGFGAAAQGGCEPAATPL
ncbi:hypothetical protein L249_1349 [Ophiocordyceps polyrhachis-furcata BCC 54312]|uniref:Uncharacterized protein n=1 Tax=Ophiocordyceps polyrhachis-furcata BCC 54312 TaxID=1330021 RepID=A0A367LEQ1_9HYPO|nr:hypothetical protein L249_1349 [Ophiocordyceps polyrhachis-furcata BCC 54312]